MEGNIQNVSGDIQETEWDWSDLKLVLLVRISERC